MQQLPRPYATSAGLRPTHPRELTDRQARQVLEGVVAGEGTPAQVFDSRGLKVVSDDTALIAAINEALAGSAGRAREDP